LIFHFIKYCIHYRYRHFHEIIAVILLMAAVPSVMAQQSSNITHYMFMNMSFNPATAGSSEGINITGLIRQQWIGFKDDHGGNTAPQNLFLAIDAPIKFLHGGISGTIISDILGAYNNIQLTLGYAYRTDLGPGEFSAGLQGNFQNSKLDMQKLEPLQPISNVGTSDFILDASLGFYYKVPDKYYLGLSCNNVLQTRMKKLLTRDRRVYDLTGGYNWVVPGYPAFELQPSAFITTDLAAYSFSVSAIVQYNKKYWGGLAYRYQDAASVLVGFTILKTIKIGLAYDASISKMTRYNDGSVEVMLNYCFKIETEKFRKSYKNTRFL
jgi:type IX secretion system PorP/SprF family membrane protein